MVESRSPKPFAAGSSPVSPAINNRGVAQYGLEYLLGVQEVASSNLVTPTTMDTRVSGYLRSFFLLKNAFYNTIYNTHEFFVSIHLHLNYKRYMVDYPKLSSQVCLF